MTQQVPPRPQHTAACTGTQGLLGLSQVTGTSTFLPSARRAPPKPHSPGILASPRPGAGSHWALPACAAPRLQTPAPRASHTPSCSSQRPQELPGGGQHPTLLLGEQGCQARIHPTQGAGDPDSQAHAESEASRGQPVDGKSEVKGRGWREKREAWDRAAGEEAESSRSRRPSLPRTRGSSSEASAPVWAVAQDSPAPSVPQTDRCVLGGTRSSALSNLSAVQLHRQGPGHPAEHLLLKVP